MLRTSPTGSQLEGLSQVRSVVALAFSGKVAMAVVPYMHEDTGKGSEAPMRSDLTEIMVRGMSASFVFSSSHYAAEKSFLHLCAPGAWFGRAQTAHWCHS